MWLIGPWDVLPDSCTSRRHYTKATKSTMLTKPKHLEVFVSFVSLVLIVSQAVGRTNSENGSILESRERLDAEQRVVGIQVIHVVARDELMLDEDRRRHGAASEQIQRHPNHAVAVLFRKVAD